MRDRVKRRTLLSWSSGKDSAWALHVLRRQPDVDVVGLFCTFNRAFDRVAMHGVRIELVRQQAESVGLPIELLPIPHPCSDDEYAAIMEAFVERARGEGIECFAFGDLLLEDVRRYREERLAGTGLTPLFPLWGLPTDELAREMVDSGLRAVITCLDPRAMPMGFAGQTYDASLLEHLPADVDPCGENGEFHTFAFDGPMFGQPVRVSVGETVTRERFVFTDLLPESHPGSTFLKRLDELQPSQLFVSAEKLSRVMSRRDPLTVETLEPVPLKRLGGRVVLTDGHTRALAAFLAGLTEIRAFWDQDDLDWEAYEICVAWCREEGIRAVPDLKDRVVPPEDYEVLWLDRCRRMHRELEARRAS